MKIIFKTFVILFLLQIFVNFTNAEDKSEQGRWIQLFNGKDLSNWKVKIKGYALGDNFGDTFRVEDGLLKVSYDKYDKFDRRFGHLFYKDNFSNYRLRVEYRFLGEQVPGGPGWAIRNSGVMVHGQSPESMGKNQDFPVSIEVQLLGGNGSDARSTSNLCTPGTNVVMQDKLVLRHCISSQSKTYHGEQWVTAEIEVRGNHVIKHLIDGQTVLSYTHPQLDERDPDAKKLLENQPKMLSGGSISLQSESHPIEFRKVELMLLASVGKVEEKEKEPLKVCILSGCTTYNSEDSLPGFQQYLEKNYNVRCTRLVRKAEDDLPGLEQLDQCDVALVFITRMELSGDQLKHFKAYMTSGRPIVAVRTASHAVQTWLDFDRQVLGGNYKGHYERGPVTTIKMESGAQGHPIFSGVRLSSAPGPLYKNAGHAKDINILMTGDSKGRSEPLAWTREYQGGRVFYTSLGTQETFKDTNFRRLLANALFWTTKREQR